MRERKSERFNIIFLSHFVQLIYMYCRVLMKKKNEEHTSRHPLFNLFRLVIVTECIINLGRERKGEREREGERGEKESSISF